jgi:hypothetical protein
MANPRDPSPAPANHGRINHEFPTIVRPDPDNPVHAQQAVRTGEHEKMLAAEAKKAGETVDYAAPSPARPMGVAKDAKDFLDSNNIRTEEQAEREEANRPRDRKAEPVSQEPEPDKRFTSEGQKQNAAQDAKAKAADAQMQSKPSSNNTNGKK